MRLNRASRFRLSEAVFDCSSWDVRMSVIHRSTCAPVIVAEQSTESIMVERAALRWHGLLGLDDLVRATLIGRRMGGTSDAHSNGAPSFQGYQLFTQGFVASGALLQFTNITWMKFW